MMMIIMTHFSKLPYVFPPPSLHHSFLVGQQMASMGNLKMGSCGESNVQLGPLLWGELQEHFIEVQKQIKQYRTTRTFQRSAATHHQATTTETPQEY